MMGIARSQQENTATDMPNRQGRLFLGSTSEPMKNDAAIVSRRGAKMSLHICSACNCLNLLLDQWQSNDHIGGQPTNDKKKKLSLFFTVS